ncbi:hypothetical protein [Metapseudomonas otitidis]|uniref:hypothetical protein n=1 Tax=Metapseudomonas otitidis TaxID=319939 RepID=UPI00244A7FBE|nr:hypothetical protein [Pseudomonas otitidis]MDG9784349.1 hypothetical protein [Pseudomonas otitidis]
MCAVAKELNSLREKFEESRNYLAFFIELAASGIELSERGRAGLLDLGMCRLRHLDEAANGQIETAAPSCANSSRC